MPKNEYEDLCERVKHELNGLMNRSDQNYKNFVCMRDLKNFWLRYKSELTSILPEQATEEDLSKVQSERLVFFTTLIFTDWPSMKGRKKFKESFQYFLNSEELSDDRLPLCDADKTLDTALDRHYIELFKEKQYMFKPHILKAGSPDSEPELVKTPRRLPFVDQPVKVGEGAGGEVFEAEIAEGCYLDTSGTPNGRSRLVAYKRFTNEYEYRQEAKVYRKLAQSTLESRNILRPLCAIQYVEDGPEFFMFLPHTELGDLAKLLNGGWSKNRVTQEPYEKYEFGKHFPQPLRSHFISQTRDIISAIGWLHDDLPKYIEGINYCAHMDLKPDNILVFPSNKANGGVGEWKLADFGLSVIASTTFSSSGSSGQITGSRTYDTKSGPYRAPELQAHEQSSKRKACDVWSMGCIMNEVFAFISGDDIGQNGEVGKERLKSFRERKERDGNSNWYTRTPLELKSEVISWLDGFTNQAPDQRGNHSWQHKFANLIRSVLNVKAEERDKMKISDIHSSLNNILKSCSDHESERSRSLLHQADGRGSSPAMPGTSRQSGDENLHRVINIRTSTRDTSAEIGRDYQLVDSDVSQDASAIVCLVKGGGDKKKPQFKMVFFRPEYEVSRDQAPLREDLPADIDWQRITIDAGLIIVRGKKGKGQDPVFELWRFEPSQKPWSLQVPNWLADCKDVIGSRRCVVGISKKGSKVQFWRPETNTRNESTVEGQVESICFNAGGDKLLVWSRTNATSYLQLFAIRSDGLSSRKGEWKLGDQTPRRFRLWLSPDGSLSVAQEAEEDARYVVILTGNDSIESKRIEEAGLGSVGWASALTDETLVTVRREGGKMFKVHTVFRRRVVSVQGDRLQVGKEEEAIPWEVGKKPEGKPKLAVNMGNEVERMVLIFSKMAKYYIQETPRAKIKCLQDSSLHH